MWRLRRVFVPVAAVGAGLALASCGGDSSPETPIAAPTTIQPSQGGAEFIAQADSICAEADSSIGQFAASGQGLTEADQIAQLRQGVVDQIKQLNPPSDTNLDAFLSAMSDEVSAGKKIGLALQRGEDTAQFESELDSAKSQAEQAASAYGFKECGKPITSSGTSTSSSSSSSSASSGGTVVPSAPSTSSGTSGTSGGTGGGTPGTSGSTGSGTSGSSGSSGSSGGSSGGVGPG
jgi:multidrug efflux pump subunit AcrA (membrane-fusion protein)